MRILSWNINGVRTLPQYHPWNTFKTFEGILDELKADIICFQEMKTSRASLQPSAALPGRFDAFFSFPANKGGYSGVAVYTDSRTVLPLKAEEGLSGRIQPALKPPLAPAERISAAYPQAHELALFPDAPDRTPTDPGALDAEGRALALDFGLFVLVNVYCPNETSDARLPFKMDFHRMLQARVAQLIGERREVVVVGDMNICAAPLDHCDGHLPSHASVFYDHPARRWFRDWLAPNGPMVDAVREFWPERDGMYTVWNMKLCARETNYGTRVDYILTTPGLTKWLKGGNTLPSVKGSDHCPIYVDLHDEITLESGQVVKLRDAMQFGTRTEPPRLASKFWPEYSGKQKLLSSFFSKGGTDTISKSPSPPQLKASSPSTIIGPSRSTQPLPPPPTASSSKSSIKPSPSPSTSHPSRPLKRKSSGPQSAETSSSNSTSQSKKRKPGQAKLSSFFTKPPAKSASSLEVVVVDDDNDDPEGGGTEHQLHADYLLACELSASQQDLVEQSAEAGQGKGKGKEAWSQLFAPVAPPKCTIHREPAKLFTVNKPGPNKGKTFYICSRPVGPGYDKGKGARPRDEVDHQYRCNFFKWASEVKKESLRQSSSKDSPGRTSSFG